MYTQYSQFWADYKMVSDYYETFTRNISWMAAPDPNRAWGIYQQALNQEWGILAMGRTCVDEAGRIPEQFGNAFTELEHQNLGVITHGDEEAAVLMGRGISGVTKATGGMVMHYYGGVNSKWRGGKSGYHFLYNDAWLLGGAHGHHEFHLASPRWEMNIWETKSGRLTATGREVVFLVNHGYELFKASWQEAYECKNQRIATAATLVSLTSAIKSITKREQILGLCAPSGLKH